MGKHNWFSKEEKRLIATQIQNWIDANKYKYSWRLSRDLSGG